MSESIAEVVASLRRGGVWVHHHQYHKAEPAGYLRDSAPHQAADLLELQAMEIASLQAQLAALAA